MTAAANHVTQRENRIQPTSLFPIAYHGIRHWMISFEHKQRDQNFSDPCLCLAWSHIKKILHIKIFSDSVISYSQSRLSLPGDIGRPTTVIQSHIINIRFKIITFMVTSLKRNISKTVMLAIPFLPPSTIRTLNIPFMQLRQNKLLFLVAGFQFQTIDGRIWRLYKLTLTATATLQVSSTLMTSQSLMTSSWYPGIELLNYFVLVDGLMPHAPWIL